jgi:hypothetical protein
MDFPDLDLRNQLVRSRGPARELFALYLPTNFGLTFQGGTWSALLRRTPRAEIVGQSVHLGHVCIDVAIDTVLDQGPQSIDFIVPVLASFDIDRSLMALQTTLYRPEAQGSRSTAHEGEHALYLHGRAFTPGIMWRVDECFEVRSGLWVPLRGTQQSLGASSSLPITIEIGAQGIRLGSDVSDTWFSPSRPPFYDGDGPCE